MAVLSREAFGQRIKIGDGGTYIIGSDRYPFTVVHLASQKCIGIQMDSFRRLDKNGPHTEIQEYEIFPNLNAPIKWITRRNDGFWREKRTKSGIYHIGERRAYLDPCF